MFQKTVNRLTVVYLAILMTISLFFSVLLYRMAIGEIEGEYGRQADLFHQRLPGLDSIEQYLSDRQDEVNTARWQIVGGLVLTNTIILGVGGFASYYLARRTLGPIEEAHEAQKRFTADASHELRTPITAMRTEIEVSLMDPKLSLKDAKTQLTSNLEELTRITNLSEGLLRLAQLDAQPLVRTDTPLAPIARTALATVQHKADKKNTTLKTKLPKDIKVHAEETALAECLTVFLDNAIKYSPRNSEVTLSARNVGRHTEITVSDNGEGIAPEKLPYIFDRFYRADDSRTASGAKNGYGLGLAIAKHIIELHGGNVSVKSTFGKGTTFTITL